MKRAFCFGLLAALTSMWFVGNAEAGHRRWRRHYYYAAPSVTVTTPAPAPTAQGNSGRQGYSSAYQASPAPAPASSAPVLVVPSGFGGSRQFVPAWGFGSGSPLRGIEAMRRQLKSQW